MTNLVNKQVTHESFGKGSIVNYDDSYIKIRFESGSKKFVFPGAFKKYLTLSDQRAANMVKIKIKERDKELAEAAIELKREKALQQRQYLLRRQETMNNRETHSSLQSVFWCKSEEQDRIFKEWNVFTGVVKSGLKKGQPRRLARVNRKSACLITARDSNMAEKDRHILGVFMVDEGFSSRDCKDGYIPAHPKYRIRLSEEESKKMLFWNYYINERSPNRMVWNSGRQRYFDNQWMAQMLREIINLKEDPKEQEYAKDFFEYFCEINNINENELPKPNGPLMRA